MSENKSDYDSADLSLANFTKYQTVKNSAANNIASVPLIKFEEDSAEEDLIRTIPIIEVEPNICEPWLYHNRDRGCVANTRNMLQSRSKFKQ